LRAGRECSSFLFSPLQLPPRKGNLFGSTASLTKAIIGSGVLGLPKAFATSGWVLSLIVLAISGLLNAIGLYFVCVCGKKLNDRTANYGTLGWRTIKMYVVWQKKKTKTEINIPPRSALAQKPRPLSSANWCT
jgi:hypothetical protein